MTPDEIVANHIKNNGLQTTPEQSMAEIRATLRENKNAHLIHINDCLFLLKVDGDEGLFYIFNGNGGLQYMKAVREFIRSCRDSGLKTLKMYVSDKDTASQLAELVGVKNVSFQDAPNRQIDPYLMIMEL